MRRLSTYCLCSSFYFAIWSARWEEWSMRACSSCFLRLSFSSFTCLRAIYKSSRSLLSSRIYSSAPIEKFVVLGGIIWVLCMGGSYFIGDGTRSLKFIDRSSIMFLIGDTRAGGFSGDYCLSGECPLPKLLLSFACPNSLLTLSTSSLEQNWIIS